MFKVSDRVQIVSIVIVAAVATLVAFGNLVQAEFTGDDWHYLALLRHIDSPFDIFTSNIAGAYFYRPVTLFLFWVSEATFGSNTVAHYSINVALHGWVALEVFALAATITKAPVPSAWAGTLFLILPATSATAIWVSDRFDLVATAGMLCSLRLMIEWTQSPTPQHGIRLRSLAMALVAIGSKETAFALIPALLLLLLGSASRASRSRLITGAAVALVAVLAVTCRIVALNGWKGDENLTVNATLIGSGGAVWLANLPIALQTHHGHVALAALGFVAFAALLFNRQGLSVNRQFGFLSSFAALLILLAGVIVAQSPIAATALPKESVQLPTVSLRFFYTPLALLVIIAAAFFARLTFKSWGLVWALRIGVASAVVISTFGSARQSETWVKNTSAEAQQAAAALAGYALIAQKHQGENPCLVRMPSAPPFLDLDLRFKTSLATSDPRMNCALLTNPAQAQTITRIRNCQSAVFSPARSTIAGLEPWQRSGTCTFFFLGE